MAKAPSTEAGAVRRRASSRAAAMAPITVASEPRVDVAIRGGAGRLGAMRATSSSRNGPSERPTPPSRTARAGSTGDAMATAAVAAPGVGQRGEIDVVVHDEWDLDGSRQPIDHREPVPDQVRRIPGHPVLRIEDARDTHGQRYDRNATTPCFLKHQLDRP